jgi:hypothetical protein
VPCPLLLLPCGTAERLQTFFYILTENTFFRNKRPEESSRSWNQTAKNALRSITRKGAECFFKVFFVEGGLMILVSGGRL